MNCISQMIRGSEKIVTNFKPNCLCFSHILQYEITTSCYCSPHTNTNNSYINNPYSKHSIVIIHKLYWSNPSVTTKHFYCYREFSALYDTFRPTGPSSGNAQYVRNTWVKIASIQCYKKIREPKK